MCACVRGKTQAARYLRDWRDNRVGRKDVRYITGEDRRSSTPPLIVPASIHDDGLRDQRYESRPEATASARAREPEAGAGRSRAPSCVGAGASPSFVVKSCMSRSVSVS